MYVNEILLWWKKSFNARSSDLGCVTHSLAVGGSLELQATRLHLEVEEENEAHTCFQHVCVLCFLMGCFENLMPFR